MDIKCRFTRGSLIRISALGAEGEDVGASSLMCLRETISISGLQDQGTGLYY